MKVVKNKINRALTIAEVLAMIAVCFMIAILLMPLFAKPKTNRNRLTCIDNLRHISTGFHNWANENGGKFPWQIAVYDGGTGGLPIDCQFLPLSNYIPAQRLVCPADGHASESDNWTDYMKKYSKKLSYFYSPNAEIYNPSSILVGDCNIESRPPVVFLNNISVDPPNLYPKWDTWRHIEPQKGPFGNIALVDSSVRKVDSRNLAIMFINAMTHKNSSNAFIKIAYP